VRSKYVVVDHRMRPAKETVLTSVKPSDTKDPVLNLYNDSKYPMALKLGDVLYHLSPREKMTLSLKRGSYNYRVTAPDLNPYYGKEPLDNFHTYAWEFYVEVE